MHRARSYLRSTSYYRARLAAPELPTDARFFRKDPGTINNKAVNIVFGMSEDAMAVDDHQGSFGAAYI